MGGPGQGETEDSWSLDGDETVPAEGGEVAPFLQTRPALRSRTQRGCSAGWGAPSARACESCRGLEETCECNCVSAKPCLLPAGQLFWH